MAGRPRLDIGTFGDITTTETAPGQFRARTRYRDEDGQTRQVTATGPSKNSARAALKKKLAERQRASLTADSLTPDSPFPDLADRWLEDVRVDPERSDGTKEVYERELRSLILPTFEHFSIREVTVARVERFLKSQREKSYARAKHSRTLLSLVMGFAVRTEIVSRNPVKETSRMRKPKRTPKALTDAQIAAIREAARDWRSEKGALGPRPDGQVRDLIEVMLGTATRIGEALALRGCDVELTSTPPVVHVTGTIVVRKGVGVFRQPKPKTDDSSRPIAIPGFVADILRRRLELVPDGDDEHLLFFTRAGTPHAPHNVRRTFRAMLKLAELDGVEITPHAFRRTGATAIANELGIETAAEVLGHTTSKTTKEHYAEPDTTVNPTPARVFERFAPRK